MNKITILSLSLGVILIASFLTLTTNTNSSRELKKSEIDTAINQAGLLYNLSKQQGVDLSSGPCLSNALLPGWVLDIAHNPRQEIDDLPQNQCPAFREGNAQHFVELDSEGNLIRAK